MRTLIRTLLILVAAAIPAHASFLMSTFDRPVYLGEENAMDLSTTEDEIVSLSIANDAAIFGVNLRNADLMLYDSFVEPIGAVGRPRRGTGAGEPVPEPASLALVGLGLMAAAWRRRK